MIAMLTYRSASSLEQRFARQEQDPKELTEKYKTDTKDDTYFFNIQSYLRYQGRKLVQRYDANCYMRLIQMMDTHDVCRGRVPKSIPEVPEFISLKESNLVANGTTSSPDTPNSFQRFKNAYHEVLSTVKQKCIVIAVESDLLYTIAEQKEMADYMPNATFTSFHAKDGHDGFLVEFLALNKIVQAFLDELLIEKEAKK